jgi:hypothetical protein
MGTDSTVSPANHPELHFSSYHRSLNIVFLLAVSAKEQFSVSGLGPKPRGSYALARNLALMPRISYTPIQGQQRIRNTSSKPWHLSPLPSHPIAQHQAGAHSH